MIEIFLNYFTNPINIAFTGMFIAVGVLVGYVYQPSPKNQVLYCREKDGRGEQYDIQNEDAISLVTKTNPALRFFKYGKSYVFTISRKLGKARKVARFIGKEGTAYTWRLMGFEKVPTKFEDQPVKEEKPEPPKKRGRGRPPKVKVKTERVPVEWEEKEIDITFPSLAEAVEHKWGAGFWNTVPLERKEQLADNKMLVTVGLESGLTPLGYKPITERQINKKANEDMASLIARGVSGAVKTPILNYLPWIGTGVAIGLVLVAIGLLQVGPTG